MTRHIQQAAELIKVHEGFRGQPYLCPAGKVTIGYGRNLDANPLTQQEAEYLMMNDINRIEQALGQQLPYYHGLSDIRKVVIISMAFQIGMHGLMQFKRMHSALRYGQYDQAADEMLDSQWARQTPKRATDLANKMRHG